MFIILCAIIGGVTAGVVGAIEGVFELIMQ